MSNSKLVIPKVIDILLTGPDRVDCAVVFPLHEVGEDVARDVG